MQGRKARSRPRYTPGVMNTTESAYAAELEARKRTGEIVDWSFEPMKLRLAKNTTYSPDFLVIHSDLSMEFVEIKGHWEDDARVKIKCAAEKFWQFFFTALKPIAKKRGGGWEREEF